MKKIIVYILSSILFIFGFYIITISIGLLPDVIANKDLYYSNRALMIGIGSTIVSFAYLVFASSNGIERRVLSVTMSIVFGLIAVFMFSYWGFT